LKIGRKVRLATATLLMVTSVIGGAVWWTYSDVEIADRQLREATETGRALSSLNLVTLEYVLNRHERARQQWHTVSTRVDDLIAASRFSDPAEREMLARVRERRAQSTKIFGELTSVSVDDDSDPPGNEINRRFAAQLPSRLVFLEQDNLAATFGLSELATKRSDAAQRRLLAVIIAGLVMIAMIKIGVSWLIHRDVIKPLAKLQHSTRQVASGNSNVKFDTHIDDEIGELSSSIDVMTKSLQKSLAQFDRSNRELALKNEELNAFSYSVSHDLRAPLRSMDGFASVLLDDYGEVLDKEGKDALNRIRAASQRMGCIIDDLLRLSQVTRAELNMADVDLSAMAREIAVALDSESSGQKAEWAIESGLYVRADPALMRIAMRNLLQNAWKFSSRAKRPVIRVGALERDSTTVYFVADNGVGFDPAHASGLFGAFQRLHHADDFPGTGIGLAIVKRIVLRHGGGLWAEAKEGQGATFFFSFKESKNGPREQDHPAG
jgi:signal transduction histidine kinase